MLRLKGHFALGVQLLVLASEIPRGKCTWVRFPPLCIVSSQSFFFWLGCWFDWQAVATFFVVIQADIEGVKFVCFGVYVVD